jgi:hypothetical protein
MNFLRDISQQEMALIEALLKSNPDNTHYIESLKDTSVVEMNDGKMGSLLLVPKGANVLKRSFGKQLATGDFFDEDGVLVSVALNVDSHGKLYELDLWKVDFSPLLRWPQPRQIKLK